MPCRLVVVRVRNDEADMASDALWSRGAPAIEERLSVDGQVELRTELPSTDAMDGFPWPFDVVEIADAWWDEWRPFARAVRVGRRVIVQPPWAPSLPSKPGDVIVLVDPGRAFGSGAHASTMLALEAMERHLVGGSSVLDVGCGSGVLSVAAALLGAGTTVAIDIDAMAVEATAANAERNGAEVDASLTPLADVDGRFDLVVANVLAPTLLELAPLLQEHLADQGAMVVSGFLADQAERVFDGLGPLVVTDRFERDGWVAGVLSAVERDHRAGGVE